MDTLGPLATAFLGFLTPLKLGVIFAATLLGMVIGMLPGLTATMGIALMVTLTYPLAPNLAILILICVYVGAIYGGSRSAILLNIPGTPANAATTLDGFPMALAGQPGRALGFATVGSVLGGLVGIAFLAFLAPPLVTIGLIFGSYEFFWLALFGVLIAGNLTSEGNPLKGWIAGLLGLIAAMLGQEVIHGYSRFSYGIVELTGGISLIPAMVGAFGMAEILVVMQAARPRMIARGAGESWPGPRELWRYRRTLVRSPLIGTAIGIVPGVGEDIGAWVSYAAAKRASAERAQFGKGSAEGILASEAGNNAAVPGAIIPVLTLAVPGSAPAAVLLAAMVLHGVRPGPMIMTESPTFVWEVVAMMTFATLTIGLLGFLLTRALIRVLDIPREVLMPIVFVLCVTGSFAIASRPFDIYVMFAFGLAGFGLRMMGYPMAPLILGVVLGELLDSNLRRGLVLSGGSLEPFFTRPISAVLVFLVAATLAFSLPPVRHAATAAGAWLRGKNPFAVAGR